MKRSIVAFVFCLAATFLGTSIGVAQEASPAVDPSVPDGAIGVDSRVFFKDGLEDVETVEFIMMTNWEMDSADAATRFFDDLAMNIPNDLAVTETTAQLETLTDDQLLITGKDEFGGPVTIVLFRHGTYLGTWMAIGDAGQDHILADLFNTFLATGFDPTTPFPNAADLPEGYTQVGA